MVPIAQAPPPAEVHPPRPGERRTHSGFPRENPLSQTSVDELQETQLQQSMAAMSIEQQYAADSAFTFGRGRSHPPPVEKPTGPPSCNDERGTSGEKINLIVNYFEVPSRQWCAPTNPSGTRNFIFSFFLFCFETTHSKKEVIKLTSNSSELDNK
ncbi:hypothetical protein AVEN_150404-1 [Araneus ventricosus]|uniref:Uncharacterized protein n=1 Tax=Araneus ventricosus TaxID=182803 RepID=A0A4Y2QZZ0_ARAVE|nr:hypothetical protein AVEN_150404-1 [Araneus ventricosus]